MKLETKDIFVELATYIPELQAKLNASTEKTMWELDKIEQLCGQKLPESFRSLYAQFDGESDERPGIFIGMSWMSAVSILQNMKTMQEIGKDYDEVDFKIISFPPNEIREEAWVNGWIPFAQGGGGTHFMIDLSPEKHGRIGQIITWDRDDQASYVVAESLADFFSMVLGHFQNGNCQWRYIEEIDSHLVAWRNDAHPFACLDEWIVPSDAKEKIAVDAFWSEYFDQSAVEGMAEKGVISSTREIRIFKDKPKKQQVVSLEILNSMPNLTEFIIHDRTVESFAPIGNATNLRGALLNGNCCTSVDLRYFAQLQRLREIRLIGQFDHIDMLKECSSLQKLSLSDSSGFSFSEIALLTQLRELSIEVKICDGFSFLSKLENLKRLEIKKIQIPNLSFLSNMPNLVSLEVDFKAVDESAIDWFTKLKNLRTAIYPFGDLSIVQLCPQLKRIGIDASTARDFSALKESHIEDVFIFNSSSEEHAEEIKYKLEKYCRLLSYSYSINED